MKLPSGELIATKSYSGDQEIQTAEDQCLALAKATASDFYGLTFPQVERLKGGRVNETFVVHSPKGYFVLQKLNDFFQGDEALGLNWLIIRQTVAERAVFLEQAIPAIYPDVEGRYITCDSWRLTEFMTGLPAPLTPAGALEAAKLLGHFHHHLNHPSPITLYPLPEGEFTNQRLSRPDDFYSLLKYYKGHPSLSDVEPLILLAAEAAAQLPLFPGFVNVFSCHEVIIHGDPKADNFLFSPTGQALSLLDWDSAGLGHVLIDVAEMLRSWGAAPERDNPVIEENLLAIIEGYAETGLWLDEYEIQLIAPVFRAVALNLCRRYLTDALALVYFKWNPQKFASLQIQNMSRAESMLDLAEYLLINEIRLNSLFSSAYALGHLKRQACEKREPQ